MDRKINEKSSYESRAKTGKAFYFNLLKIVLLICLVGCAGLAYLYQWLVNYEAHSPQGAMRSYMERVYNQEWDSLYQEDIENFPELNTKEAISQYLYAMYAGKNHWGMTYAFSSADSNLEYYNVYYEHEKISTLELIKPEGSDTWKVRTVNKNGTYNFEVYDDATFKINNTPITPSYPNENRIAPVCFEDLDLDEELPGTTRYTIGSFVGLPAVTSDSKNTIVLDNTYNTFYIGPSVTSEQEEEFSSLIETAAIDYCKFITKDGSLYTFLQHLYPNTVFYQNIIGFDNQWFSPHETIEFQNINVHDLFNFDDQAFTGKISFDYIVTSTRTSKTYSSTYQLYYVKNSYGQWRLTDLVIIDETKEE